jgi:hypothetical protein
LTDDALADLNALPIWLQRIAESFIMDTLAKDPVRASSTPAKLDHGREVGARSNLQVGPVDGLLHQLTFLFQYGEDEAKIKITQIGYLPVRLPGDW